jgi:hypothetical protein
MVVHPPHFLPLAFSLVAPLPLLLPLPDPVPDLLSLLFLVLFLLPPFLRSSFIFKN